MSITAWQMKLVGAFCSAIAFYYIYRVNVNYNHDDERFYKSFGVLLHGSFMCEC